MERRLFLAGATSGLIAPFLRDWPVTSYAALISALPIAHTATIQAVGRDYLAVRPGLDVAQLVTSAFGEDALVNPPSPAQARALAAERRRDDFLQGRSIIIDRWVLAESEAAICALLAAVL